MPIFDARGYTGSGSSRVRVESAKGYSDHDMGRIMSECATNDIRLFNAAIARDFKEAQAVHEGTMVSSELRSFQEFSIQEAWKGLKEKLKKLWGKIKNVFRTVYAKLSLYLNRNVKAYVAQNKKYLLKKKNLGTCKLPKYRKVKGDIDSVKTTTAKKVDDAIEILKNVKTNGASTAAKLTLATKHTAKEGKEADASAAYEEMEEKVFEDTNMDLTWADLKYPGGVNGLCNNLLGNSKYLKSLKKKNKDMDNRFKKAIQYLDAQGAAGSKDADGNERSEAARAGYQRVSEAVGYIQTGINAETSAFIRIIKKLISNDRGLMAALVAHDPTKTTNENAVMTEFAFAAGHDDYFHEVDDMSEEEVEAEAEDAGITTVTIEIDGDAEVDVNDETSDDE